MQVAFLVDAEDEAVEVVLGRRDGVLVDYHLDGHCVCAVEAVPAQSRAAPIGETMTCAIVVHGCAFAVIVDLLDKRSFILL